MEYVLNYWQRFKDLKPQDAIYSEGGPLKIDEMGGKFNKNLTVENKSRFSLLRKQFCLLPLLFSVFVGTIIFQTQLILPKTLLKNPETPSLLITISKIF